MIRQLWLIVSVAAAIVFATPVYNQLPTILDWLTSTTLKGAYINLLRTDPAVLFAGHFFAGALILTAMAYVALAIIEGLLVASTQASLVRCEAEATSRSPFNEDRFRDCFSAAPFLADIADVFSTHLVTAHGERPKRKGANAGTERIKALASCRSFFGPHALVDHRLFWWLFAPLPAVIMAFGGIVAAISFARIGPDGTLGTASEGSAIAAVVLALALFAATIVYALTRGIRQYRSGQAEKFSAILDALLDVSPASRDVQSLLADNQARARTVEESMQSLGATIAERIVASEQSRAVSIDNAARTIGRQLKNDLEAALRDPLAEMAKAVKTANADQGAQIQQLLRTTLKSFVSDLEKQVTGHAKNIDHSLSAAASAADKIEKSFSEATKTFNKTTKSQATDLSDALERGVKALSDFEKKSRTDVAADLKTVAERMEKIAAVIAPIVEEVKINQAALLDAIQGEASSSKIIADAAKDLNAAARAGKETLEGFVTLAREMREVSRSLAQRNQAPSAQPQPIPTTVGKGFGDDLKKLRELAAERKLPEL